MELVPAGTAQRVLNLGDLAEYLLLAPPHPEQRAIVAFLDHETAKIDALMTKKERLIELLQEKRAALITRAVKKASGWLSAGDSERAHERFWCGVARRNPRTLGDEKTQACDTD